MNLGDLRQYLLELEEFEDDTPVRICTQPNYPLRFDLAGIVLSTQGIVRDLELALEEGDNEGKFEPEILAEYEERMRHGTQMEVVRKIAEAEKIPIEVRLLTSFGHPQDGSPYGDKDDWENAWS